MKTKRYTTFVILIILTLIIGFSLGNLASATGIWWQNEDHGYTYDTEYTSNNTDTTYTQNGIGICANVTDVTDYGGKQEIDVSVAASGFSNDTVEYIEYGDNDFYQLYSTAGVKIKAKIGSDAPSTTSVDLDSSYHYRGNMTDYDGYNDIGGNGNSEFWNHIKNTGIKATHEVIGSTPILGPIYNANVFIANEFASGGANFVDDDDGTGPSSKAYAEFRALPNFFEISDWNNRINYEDGGEGDYYLYTAETHFTVTLPDSTDEPHTLNLKFSAINKMYF